MLIKGFMNEQGNPMQITNVTQQGQNQNVQYTDDQGMEQTVTANDDIKDTKTATIQPGTNHGEMVLTMPQVPGQPKPQQQQPKPSQPSTPSVPTTPTLKKPMAPTPTGQATKKATVGNTLLVQDRLSETTRYTFKEAVNMAAQLVSRSRGDVLVVRRKGPEAIHHVIAESAYDSWKTPDRKRYSVVHLQESQNSKVVNLNGKQYGIHNIDSYQRLSITTSYDRVIPSTAQSARPQRRPVRRTVDPSGPLGKRILKSAGVSMDELRQAALNAQNNEVQN